VSFIQIPDSLWDLTQRVTPVDDWNYFSGFKEPLHDFQVCLAQMRQKWEELLAHNASTHQRALLARPVEWNVYGFSM
jgi:hypothetical protein